VQTAERNGGSAEFSNDGGVFYSNIVIPLKNDSGPADGTAT